MRDMLRTTGRLLRDTAPALLAWFLAGVLARYVLVELAGIVGAYTALGGMLLLPLAILARLVSFVAMFLVLRDGMARLSALAPVPESARQRRRSFVDAVLTGILPFFAFYAGAGYLNDDVHAYMARALRVQTEARMASVVTGEQLDFTGTIDDLRVEPITIALIVVAFAGRWAWKRYRDRLPRATAVGAVYLEALWVFLSVIVIAQILGGVQGWVDTRQAMDWLGDARSWVSEFLTPVGLLWDGVEWLIGALGAALLVPLSWLAIAGVVYGQAVAAQAPVLSGRIVERARGRYDALPQRVRRRVGDVGSNALSRFQPIWRALVLMWRAGPVLIGGYVLLFAVLVFLQDALLFAVTRVFGPHDLETFWLIADTLILLIVPLLLEPLRIALVAGAYDATLFRLVPAPPPAPSEREQEQEQEREDAAGSGVDGEASEAGQPLG